MLQILKQCLRKPMSDMGENREGRSFPYKTTLKRSITCFQILEASALKSYKKYSKRKSSFS